MTALQHLKCFLSTRFRKQHRIRGCSQAKTLNRLYWQLQEVSYLLNNCDEKDDLYYEEARSGVAEATRLAKSLRNY